MIARGPLSIGEIVDRAVTIGLRNARALSLVVVLPVLVASAIYVFYVLRVAPYARSWAAITHAPMPPSVAGPSPFDRLAALLLVCAATTLAAAACALIVEGANTSVAIEPGACAAAIAARWPAMLGLGLVGFAVHVPEAIATSLHAVLAEWAFLPLEAWCGLMVMVALCAVMVEGRGAGEALVAAFRWSGGSGLGSAAGVALAILALAVVATFVTWSFAGGAIAVNAAWAILPAIVVEQTVVSVLILLVAAVYYFNCRVVRDGYGLA